MLYVVLISLLFAAFYQLVITHKKLKIMQSKNEKLYHDINSFLVIFTLTQESFEDISLELQNSRLHSLIFSLKGAIHDLEENFRTWDF